MRLFGRKENTQAQRDMDYYTRLVKNDLENILHSGGRYGTFFERREEGVFRKIKYYPIQMQLVEEVLGSPISGWCIGGDGRFYHYHTNEFGERILFSKPCSVEECAREIVIEKLQYLMRKYGCNH